MHVCKIYVQTHSRAQMTVWESVVRIGGSSGATGHIGGCPAQNGYDRGTIIIIIIIITQ